MPRHQCADWDPKLARRRRAALSWTYACVVLRTTLHANMQVKVTRAEAATEHAASQIVVHAPHGLHGRLAHAGRHQRVLQAHPTDTASAQRLSDDVDY